MSTPDNFDDLDLRDLDELDPRISAPEERPQPPRTARPAGDPSRRAEPSQRPARGLVPRAQDPQEPARPRPQGYQQQNPNPQRESSYRQDPEPPRYTTGYAYPPYGGSGGGGGNGSGGGGKRNSLSSNLTIVALVALISFFTGFASRNTYDNIGGFDDERLVTAQEIPTVFRTFCISYNGYPSFTLVQLTSISTLSVSSVPILRLDTCTIPVNQTANALQALGIQRRADTIGPQLGGSNLTLMTLPATNGLARTLLNQFPQLAEARSGPARPEAEVIRDLELAIANSFTSGAEGLDIQSLISTNIPGVFAMVPGHSFNLRTDIRDSL